MTSTVPSPSTSTRRTPGRWCVAGRQRFVDSTGSRGSCGATRPRDGGLVEKMRDAALDRGGPADGGRRSQPPAAVRKRVPDFSAKEREIEEGERGHALGAVRARPALQADLDAQGHVRRGFLLKVDDADRRSAAEMACRPPALLELPQGRPPPRDSIAPALPSFLLSKKSSLLLPLKSSLPPENPFSALRRRRTSRTSSPRVSAWAACRRRPPRGSPPQRSPERAMGRRTTRQW